jgi:hypothetical protein
MPKPDVEKALSATMAEIRKGAAPWTVKEGLLTRLKTHYRPEFDRNRANWPKVKGKLLRLARYQGAIAALLAESVHPERSAPGQVDAKSLWTASWIVQIGCPPDAWIAAQNARGITTAGKNCRAIPASLIDVDLLKRVGSRIQEITPSNKVHAVAAALSGSMLGPPLA